METKRCRIIMGKLFLPRTLKTNALAGFLGKSKPKSQRFKNKILNEHKLDLNGRYRGSMQKMFLEKPHVTEAEKLAE